MKRTHLNYLLALLLTPPNPRINETRQLRKRKIFTGSRTAIDLIEILKKHKNEKYIFPCSNIRKNDIPNFLEENGYQHSEAVIYKTVASDLSDLADVNYDIIAFYSPSGINSLFVNFPDFKQNKRFWACFARKQSLLFFLGRYD